MTTNTATHPDLPATNVCGHPLITTTCCGVLVYDSHGDQLCAAHR